MKQLSKKEKKKIVKLIYVKGKSRRRVAKILGRNKGTINYFVRRYEETGTTARRRILSKEEKGEIVRLVREKPTATLRGIRKRLGLRVSLPTISRYLNKRGYHCEDNQTGWLSGAG